MRRSLVDNVLVRVFCEEHGTKAGEVGPYQGRLALIVVTRETPIETGGDGRGTWKDAAPQALEELLLWGYCRVCGWIPVDPIKLRAAAARAESVGHPQKFLAHRSP